MTDAMAAQAFCELFISCGKVGCPALFEAV